ncbi:hypothetical protein C8Q76DRAFT_762371 [Earliella scabrosa]|nr:hypothetical protein C8Q76DRAFT_762371 [Earliella scabrosa]
MASALASSSAAYAVPSLKYYFSPTTFHDRSRSSSRPFSSSSNSSYTGPPTSPSPHVPLSATSYFAHAPEHLYDSHSAFASCPASASNSPMQENMSRMTRLTRPLPTPPTTPSPQSVRVSLPPRPLPRPPIHRSQSYQTFRHPLPTPPLSAPDTPPEEPVASTSTLPAPATGSVVESTAPNRSRTPTTAALPPVPSERPSIRLEIPSAPPLTPSSLKFATPLSPIAFNIPGPRDLRRRREEELSRRMTELGFVESPRTPKDPSSASTSACASTSTESSSGPASSLSPSHERNFSISSVESEGDAERDVVLLVDCESDVEEHPTRSESRQAMLTLFADDEEDEPKLEAIAEIDVEPCRPSAFEIQVDVEVEVITQEAVARTKRRFSRKWIRERKGKRYTEQDFSEIIAELRKLR